MRGSRGLRGRSLSFTLCLGQLCTVTRPGKTLFQLPTVSQLVELWKLAVRRPSLAEPHLVPTWHFQLCGPDEDCHCPLTSRAPRANFPTQHLDSVSRYCVPCRQAHGLGSAAVNTTAADSDSDTAALMCQQTPPSQTQHCHGQRPESIGTRHSATLLHPQTVWKGPFASATSSRPATTSYAE